MQKGYKLTRGKHKAGDFKAICKECGKEMIFEYYCHARVRRFCGYVCYGISRRKAEVITNQHGPSRQWTEEEDNLLRAEYPKYVSIAEIVNKFVNTNRSINVLRKRAKILGVQREQWALRESYKRGGMRNKGRPRPDLVKNAFRGSGPLNPFYGKTHTEESRKVISEKAKASGTLAKLNKDPEFQRKRMKGLHARPNKPEETINSILEELYPGEYKFTGDGSFIVDGLNPDFVNVNGQNKIIEVFGEQYHDPVHAVRPLAYRSTEAGRRESLAKHGYSVLVIWSKEIYLGGKEARTALRDKIRRFHEDCSS